MDNYLKVINYKKDELINDVATSNLSVPEELKQSVNAIIKTSIENKNLFLTKEVLEKKLEVVLKPNIQRGIEEGKYIMDKGALEIRDKATGQFVGKAKLEERLVKSTEKSPLSSIQQGIVNISGQVQMAEISKKLDVLNEKIDLLAEFLWREKISELSGLNSIIKEAVASLPNDNAIERINTSIKDLSFLSNFFKKTIDELLSKKIEYKIYDNILEGFKVWEWKEENRKEYTKKYNIEVQDFIREYGFLLELYFQTLGLIGTSYQLIDEYHHASNYFKRIEVDLYHYSEELMKELIYLLDIQLEDENYILPQFVIEKLEDRKLPEFLLEEISSFNNQLLASKNAHTKLVSQFDNIQLSYELDPKLIEGDI